MTGLAFYAEHPERLPPLRIAPYRDPMGWFLKQSPTASDPRVAADYMWFRDHPDRRFRMRNTSRIRDGHWHVSITDRYHLNRTLNFSVDVTDRRIPPPAFWQDEIIIEVLRDIGRTLPEPEHAG
ncbi:MAG: hypothetical protein M9932_11595 [Xanthobacteraceae bacterium]|nr:hypothetical protein [Xanthobacteraceae bacterium]